MTRGFQFTLRYLLLETLWIGLGLGFARIAIADLPNTGFEPLQFVVVPAAIACFGLAIGGLVGRMWTGYICACVLILALIEGPRGTTCRHTMKGSGQTQLTLLADAVKTYQLDVGELPPDLDALLVQPDGLTTPTKWAGPYLEKQQLPTDPWNSSYEYAISNKSRSGFSISSKGPDQISGTVDDIRGPID